MVSSPALTSKDIPKENTVIPAAAIPLNATVGIIAVATAAIPAAIPIPTTVCISDLNRASSGSSPSSICEKKSNAVHPPLLQSCQYRWPRLEQMVSRPKYGQNLLLFELPVQVTL